MASFFSKWAGSTTVTSQNAKFKTRRLLLRLQDKTGEQFEQSLGNMTTDLSKMTKAEVEDYIRSKFGELRKVIIGGIDELQAFIKSKEPTKVVRKLGESDASFQKREAEYQAANADYVRFLEWVRPILKSLSVWLDGVLQMLRQFLQDMWEAKQRGEDYVAMTDRFVEAFGAKMMDMSSISTESESKPGPDAKGATKDDK